MPVAAAIIGSSLVGAGSSYLAGKAQEKGAQKSRAYLSGQYDELTEGIDESLAPYSKLGEGATMSLGQWYNLSTFENRGNEGFNNAAMDAFRDTPGYKFTRDEILNASTNENSSGIGVRSGRHNEVLGERAGQLADTMWRSSWLDPMLKMAGMGQHSAHMGVQSKVNAAGHFAPAIAGTHANEGAARASGIMGVGNAIQSGLSGYAGNQQFQQALTSGYAPQGYSPTTNAQTFNNVPPAPSAYGAQQPVPMMGGLY